MNDFTDIKLKAPLLSFIMSEAKDFSPKKVGASTHRFNPCPLPGCKANDSFTVDTSKENFVCFSCDRSGDIYTFVEYFKGITESYEQLKYVANAVGVPLPNGQSNGHNGKQKPKVDPIKQKIFNSAAVWYKSILAEDKKVLELLKKERRYTQKFLKDQPIGYTGNKRGDFTEAMKKKGYSEEQLLGSGLLAKNDDGKIYEFFGPQYLIYFNSRDNKNVADFTVKDALKSQRKQGEERKEYRLRSTDRIGEAYYNDADLTRPEVILVEGQNDLLQVRNIDAEQPVVGGVKNFADKDRVARLKKSFQGKRVYFAFDMDAAGKKFLTRAFEALWGNLTLYVMHWEAYSDIDEYLRKQGNPQHALKELKSEGMELSRYLVKQFKDFEDPGRALEELKDFIEVLKKPMVDPIQLTIALEAIKEHFSNKAIFRTVEKIIRDHQFRVQNSGPTKTNIPYSKEDGVYVKHAGKGMLPFTNFTLELQDVIRSSDTLYYRCNICNDKGQISKDVLFSPEARTNRHKFKTAIANYGGYHFTGKDEDLSGIWLLEEEKNVVHSQYVQNYGWLKNDHTWLFQNCAMYEGKVFERNEEGFININGQNLKAWDVIVYGGAAPYVNLEKEFTKEFAQEVTNNWHQMIDASKFGKLETAKGLLMLGFLPASIYSAEIFERYKACPFLFAYGQPGTGKTAAMTLLLNAFGFNSQPESWPSATKDGTHKFLQHLSSLPCWYDEFLNDRTFARLFNTLKNLYNRTSSGKGGLERRQVQEVNGCLWLSGEDNPQNEALLGRSVIIRFDKVNGHKTTGYNWMVKNKSDLSAIMRHLILSKTPETVETLLSNIDRITQLIQDRIPEINQRVALNHAIPAASLYLIGADIPEGFIDYVVEHANQAAKNAKKENPVHKFFEELSQLMIKYPEKSASCIKTDQVDLILYVEFNTAIRMMAEMMKLRNETMLLKRESIKDYLGECEFLNEFSDRAYFLEGRRRCMSFRITGMPEEIRELYLKETNKEV